MQSHEQRVVTEKSELDEKISKLSTFIASGSEAYAKLEQTERDLLRAQLTVMSGYSEILGSRIKRFQPEQAEIEEPRVQGLNTQLTEDQKKQDAAEDKKIETSVTTAKPTPTQPAITPAPVPVLQQSEVKLDPTKK